MKFGVRRLSRSLGAEIQGTNLGAPLSQSAIDEIRQIWLDHNIILFRGCDLSPENQVAFTRTLGELESNASVAHLRHPENPDIVLISNAERGDGKKYDKTGQMWHSDHSFIRNPTLASVLYAMDLPVVGGDTMFANMYDAYDALSDGMKALLEPLEAVHDNMRGVGQLYGELDKATIERLRTQTPPVVHRVIRVHPETGRRALYVSEMFTTRFVGMTEEESRPLLEYLFRHSVQPQFTYRHHWKKGDMIVWDNRCTMHLALTDFDVREKRNMHRTCVLGETVGRYENEPAAIQGQ